MGEIEVLLVASTATTQVRVRDLLACERSLVLLPNVVDDSQAILVVERHRPDILLLQSPGVDRAIELARTVSSLSIRTKTLMLYSRPDESIVAQFLAYGGSGCVDSESDVVELVRAIHAVHAGEMWASRRVIAAALTQALKPLARAARRETLERQLSKRECEIVEWIRCGMTNKEIARQLGISDMTVKTHVHNIFHKLEVSGRVRLLGLANIEHTRHEKTDSHASPGVDPEVLPLPLIAKQANGLKPAA